MMWWQRLMGRSTEVVNFTGSSVLRLATVLDNAAVSVESAPFWSVNWIAVSITLALAITTCTTSLGLKSACMSTFHI